MFNSLKRWCKTPGGATACSIFVVTTALFLLDFFCLKTPPKQYVSGIITEFIGIIVTVVFVQFLFDRKTEQDSKKQEKNKILQSNVLLQRYLKKYIELFYCVTTPISERDMADVKMKDTFTFKDMSDLHKTSLLVTEPIFQSAINRFLAIELHIRNHIISILNNISFKYYSEIPDILLKFVDVSIAGDVREALSNMDKIDMGGGEKGTDFACKMLREQADCLYNDLKSGKLCHANFVHPYFFLYEMMNEERELIKSYLIAINLLDNN